MVSSVITEADLKDYIGGDLHLAFEAFPAKLLYGTVQSYEILEDGLKIQFHCLGEARSSIPEFPPPDEWSRENYDTAVVLSKEGTIEPHRITFRKLKGGPLVALYPPNTLAPF